MSIGAEGIRTLMINLHRTCDEMIMTLEKKLIPLLNVVHSDPERQLVRCIWAVSETAENQATALSDIEKIKRETELNYPEIKKDVQEMERAFSIAKTSLRYAAEQFSNSQIASQKNRINEIIGAKQNIETAKNALKAVMEDTSKISRRFG